MRARTCGAEKVMAAGLCRPGAPAILFPAVTCGVWLPGASGRIAYRTCAMHRGGQQDWARGPEHHQDAFKGDLGGPICVDKCAKKYFMS